MENTYELGVWENFWGHNPDVLCQCIFSYLDDILFQVHTLLAVGVLLNPHTAVGGIVGCKVRPLAVLELILCLPGILRSASAGMLVSSFQAASDSGIACFISKNRRLLTPNIAKVC